MTYLYRLILKHICKKLVVQGHNHENNIIAYFEIIIKSAEKEFTEDNNNTLNQFLEGCFIKAQKRTVIK